MGRDASRRALTPAVLVSLLAAPAAALDPPPRAAPPLAPRSAVVFSGPAMGSHYTVRVVMRPGDEQANERVRAAIEGVLARVDRLFSRWRPESEVSRLSAHASTEPFGVSPDTMAVLDLARKVSDLTGGAFDVTVAPLVEAWGFGPGGRAPEAPADAALADLRARVGYRQLAIDPARGTVTKARPDVGCDVAAVAGGWASDRVAAAVAALGHPDVLVDVGGEVTARGRRPDGRPWRVAIEWPDGAREKTLVIALENATVATSGNDRNAWTDGQGRLRSHIIDPRTGEPVAHGLASASVVDRDGARADALATALLVLGPDEGRALAARERLAARLVRREADGSYAEWSTPAFDALVPRAR